jgi:hypothetical protein
MGLNCGNTDCQNDETTPVTKKFLSNTEAQIRGHCHMCGSETTYLLSEPEVEEVIQ